MQCYAIFSLQNASRVLPKARGSPNTLPEANWGVHTAIVFSEKNNGNFDPYDHPKRLRKQVGGGEWENLSNREWPCAFQRRVLTGLEIAKNSVENKHLGQISVTYW